MIVCDRFEFNNLSVHRSVHNKEEMIFVWITNTLTLGKYNKVRTSSHIAETSVVNHTALSGNYEMYYYEMYYYER